MDLKTRIAIFAYLKNLKAPAQTHFLKHYLKHYRIRFICLFIFESEGQFSNKKRPTNQIVGLHFLDCYLCYLDDTITACLPAPAAYRDRP